MKLKKNLIFEKKKMKLKKNLIFEKKMKLKKN